jgi:double-stranded RNA binding protein
MERKVNKVVDERKDDAFFTVEKEASTVHPKNQLQEYFQKRNLPLPIFETTNVGGSFVSTVSYTLNGTHTFRGQSAHSKKTAETLAAHVALAHIEKLERPKVKILGETYIFLDVENRTDCLAYLASLELAPEIRVWCFYGRSFQAVNKIPSHFRTFPILTTRQNGADVAIIIAVTKLLVEKSMLSSTLALKTLNPRIWLVSNDSFASSLPECLPCVGLSNKVTTLCSLNELKQGLEQV